MILPILLNKTKLLPIYVIGMGTQEHQRAIDRKQGFAGHQLLYCTAGSGVFSIEGREYVIQKGDAFYFRPNVPHSYRPTSAQWRTRWVVFTGSAASDIMDYLDCGSYEVFRINDFDAFELQVNALSDMFWCDAPDKEIKTSMLMYKLLIQMGECRNNQVSQNGLTQTEKYEKLSPVVELIKTRYREDLSLSEMADLIGVSSNHLCRLFHQVYQTTPLKYLTHVRLNMAKYYLCSPKNLRVKEISEAVGFRDASYFSAVFKKAEGMTPDAFRKINSF